MKLAGKVAFVTGAGRRIGRAIAMALAGRGAKIAVHYLSSRDEAESLVQEIRRAGGDAQFFRANLEDVSEIEAGINATLAHFGRLDVLVNSASVFYRMPYDDITERDWDLNLAVNLKAPFFAARFAAAAMRRQGAGKIVNLGDWAGIRPYKSYLPYAVAKSGLIGLTRALARELAPEVQVNCIALGPVMPPDDYSAEEIDHLRQATLTKTIGSPDDVAKAVLFLCEGTDFATGSTLLLDGGRLLG
jgi:pteridine reductase